MAGRTFCRSFARLTAVSLLVGLFAGSAGSAEPERTLRILSRTPLPTASSVARDIRWASENSVYVAHAIDGVSELGLEGAKKRALVPATGHLGRIQVPGWPGGLDIGFYGRLAASGETLAVSGQAWFLAWRSLKLGGDRSYRLETRPFANPEAFDLQGDRVLLLGMRDNIYRLGVESHGEIAWLGTLSSGLADLKPIYYDRSGPRMPAFCHCRARMLGAARFLGDGSFVLVPGFEKGVHLFSPSGQLERSWTGEQLGVDTDCTGMSAEEEEELGQKPASWQRWLNQHRTVDDVLPLPQGPGLLVRSWGADNQVHWELEILAGSRIETWSVPIAGPRPTDRLRGDVRGDRIVLLLSGSGFNGPPQQSDPTGEIVVAAVPHT